MNTPGTTKPAEYAIPKAQAGEVLKTLEGHGATFVHHDDRVEVTVDGATVTIRYLEDVKAVPGWKDRVSSAQIRDMMVGEEAMNRALDRVSIGGQSGQPMNRAQRRAMAKRERKSRARAGRR